MAERPAPSGIRAVFERANQLEREGRSIVHLEIGRPHADSPAEVKAAAVRALEAGAVHYTANRGTPELRAALVDAVARRGGPRYDPDTEAVVTAGASEACASVALGLLEPGDEVLVPEPAWPHYAGHVAMAGARAVRVACPASDGFLPDPDRLAAALTPRTRMLVLASPANPTGAVAGAEHLHALADLAVRRDLLVLSDEIYERFVHDGEHASIATLDGMRERTIVAGSCSKAWAMDGWRVGWALAPASLAEAVNVIHQHLSVCAPAFAQAGATVALRDGGAFAASLAAEYRQRRDEVVAGLDGLVSMTPPPGAFYAFPDVGRDGAELALALLEGPGVAVVPGAVFGAGFERHIRISYGVSAEVLGEGIARIRAFLAR